MDINLLITNIHEDMEDNKSLYSNFLLFCSVFSVTHAAVDGMLAYSLSELGTMLGSISAGLLYVCYSFSSLLFAKPILQKYGSKVSLLVGLFSMLCYVTTFLIALAFPNLAWYFCIPGSIIGGLGAGVLWTSQSAYYSKSALIYATQTGIPQEEVTSSFASAFAFIYLGCETILSAFITLMYLIYGDNTHGLTSWTVATFAIFALLAITASFCGFFIQDFGLGSGIDRITFASYEMKDEVVSVYCLLIEHKSISFLVPYQLSFGFCMAFIIFYLNGIILPEAGRSGYIGALSALITLVAAISAGPVNWCVDRSGKFPIVIIGAVLLLWTSGQMFFLNNEDIASWPVVVILCIAYGCGRGVWENTNKALITDIFSDNEIEREVAFAAIYFLSGLGASIGLFCFSFMTRLEIAGLVTAVSITSVLSIVAMSLLHPIKPKQETLLG